MIPVLRGSVAPTTSGAAATPLLVLGGSLGLDTTSWDAMLPALTATHRVLRFDLPGHGASPAPAGPFTTAELADAVVALVDDVGGGRFAYAGLSIGGTIGIEIATGRHADRLDALAVICSDARLGDAGSWTDRVAQVRRQGTASLVTASAARWFAPGFADRDPDTVGAALNALVGADDGGYAACCAALADFDRRADAGTIRVPTAVITGDVDPVVTVAQGDALAAAIPGASRTVLVDCGHQANLERPAELAAALAALLSGAGPGLPLVATSRTPEVARSGNPGPQPTPELPLLATPSAPEVAKSGNPGPQPTPELPLVATPTTPEVAKSGNPGPARAGADPASDRFAEGMAVRRAVLGARHVDAATARITPETADFQRYITETAWGTVWTRPGLERRLRSAVTLSSLVTGGHHDELKLHLRAALTNGLSRAEVSEILLQTAVYAGVPAANTAFGVWRGVVAELDEEAAE